MTSFKINVKRCAHYRTLGTEVSFWLLVSFRSPTESQKDPPSPLDFRGLSSDFKVCFSF